MSRDEVIAACVAAEVPSGPINSIADIFADPHFRARDDLLAVNVPTIGEVTVPGVYPKLSATPGSVDSLGPELGNANEEVYGGQLGLSADDMAALKDKGVI